MKLLYDGQWKGARSQSRSTAGGHGEALSMGAPASTAQVNKQGPLSKITTFFLDGKRAVAAFF